MLACNRVPPQFFRFLRKFLFHVLIRPYDFQKNFVANHKLSTRVDSPFIGHGFSYLWNSWFFREIAFRLCFTWKLFFVVFFLLSRTKILPLELKYKLLSNILLIRCKLHAAAVISLKYMTICKILWYYFLNFWWKCTEKFIIFDWLLKFFTVKNW